MNFHYGTWGTVKVLLTGIVEETALLQPLELSLVLSITSVVILSVPPHSTKVAVASVK